MTTNDRIHEQGFCYDDDLPPSIPPGAPLRGARARSPERRGSARETMMRSCHRRLTSLRGRLRA